MPWTPQIWDKVKGRIVRGAGPMPARIMVVGEMPGVEEGREGVPFYGPSGEELTRYLREAGISRGACYVTNLIKVVEKEPSIELVDEWEAGLIHEIKQCKPEIIVAVGAWASRWFIFEEDWARGGMDVMRGIPYRPPITFHNAVIIPVMHPAAGLWNDMEMVKVWDDFQQVGKMVRGEIGIREMIGRGKYKEKPELDLVNRAMLAPIGWPAIDTEGSEKKAWGLSYCLGHEAVVVRGQVSTALMQGVTFHHALHDLPVLKQMGMDILGQGIPFADTMVKAYVLGRHPQGLKALAYRLLGLRMKSYEEVMSEADRRVALDYLKLVLDTAHDPNSGDWDWLYEQQEIVVWGTKAKDYKIKKPWSAGKRIEKVIKDLDSGKKVDIRDRWANLNPELKQPIIEALDDMPVATLDDVEDQRVAVDYSAEDAYATFHIDKVLDQEMDKEGVRGIYDIDIAAMPMFARMMEVGMGIDQGWLRTFGDQLSGIMHERVLEIEKMVGHRVNPDSGDQVADLLYGELGLTPPRMTEGGEKKASRGSTDDKCLQALISKHQVVRLIDQYREASKLRNTYAKKLPWLAARSEDGRIHGRYKTTRVITGRPSMEDPNLLAQPVRSELALGIRKGFVPRPGWKIIEWDYDQIEMREAADASGDKHLCELFNQNLDVHAHNAAMMFRIPVEAVDEMKHRYPAKRVGFGILTGISGAGLLDQMVLAGISGWTVNSCTRLISDWFRVNPGIKAYLEACKVRARESGESRCRYGRRRILPGIRSGIKRVRAEAERAAHSFEIQASAAGLIKRAMAQVWDMIGYWKRWGIEVDPMLQIYDSIVVEAKVPGGKSSHYQEVRDTVGEIMCEVDRWKVPIRVKSKWSDKSWGEVEK